MQDHLQDRVLAGMGSGLTVAVLGLLLLRGLAVDLPFNVDRPLALIHLELPHPPPPRPRPPVERPQTEKAKGASSPRNLKNKATDVVAPPPVVMLPPPPLRVTTTLVPGPGTAASTGASNLPGPGHGGGGIGDGEGSGDGDGDGDTPPRLIKGRLKFSDLPPDLRETGKGGSVSVRYRVETDGRVTGCFVTASSGIAELDSATCQLIEERFRYKPSLDPDGRPVRSAIVESHSWIVDRSDYTP